MAAHDDQISNNRRRLFKALSTAPVVMTLRPGTAAASSAYQCVAKLPSPQQLWKPSTVSDCGDGIDCYVYQERRYWDVSECGYVGDPAIVVETQPGIYFTGAGEPASVTLHPSGGLKQFTVGVESYTCGTTGRGIPSEDGLFLVVGEAQPSVDEAEFFSYRGVYPEKQIFGTGQQGISGTCLGSIPNDVTGSFTLAKG